MVCAVAAWQSPGLILSKLRQVSSALWSVSALTSECAHTVQVSALSGHRKRHLEKEYPRILFVLDRASYWYLNKGRPTWWHLLYYVNLLLNMVQPALGYHITNSQSRYITPTHLKSAQYSLHNNAISSRKLLKMDVLTSETCWAVNWHNKASVIKLIYLYSSIQECKLGTPWHSKQPSPRLSLHPVTRLTVYT